MPTIPDWALALTFWIHFLAAVTLVGSLVAYLRHRVARRTNSGSAQSIEFDCLHSKADGACDMVQLESADRDGFVSDEPQYSLQRFSIGKQSMDHCHFGQAHFGGSADRG